MSDDHHDEERPEYDPESPAPPDKEPPLRSTAPQGEYTMGQVGFGAVIALVGILITLVVPIALA